MKKKENKKEFTFDYDDAQWFENEAEMDLVIVVYEKLSKA